jgi:hypothetical protein
MARLAEGLREQSGAHGSETYVRDLVAARLNDPDSPVFTMLRSLLEPDELRAYLRNPTYEVHPPEPNPRMLVETLARSTQVVGKMLEGLTASTALQPQAALIARLGHLAWGLVQVAIPQSFPNLLFAHWRNVLGLFGVFLIVLAVVMGSWSLASSGLILIVSLAIVSVVVHTLGSWLTRRPTAPKIGKLVWPKLRALVVGAGVIIALLAMLGVQYLAERVNTWLGS